MEQGHQLGARENSQYARLTNLNKLNKLIKKSNLIIA
jgi:hypothetical protein